MQLSRAAINRSHCSRSGWAPLRDFYCSTSQRKAWTSALARLSELNRERLFQRIPLRGLGAPEVGEYVRQYLNRLSDLLFVLGRTLNRAGQRGDVLWRHQRKKRK